MSDIELEATALPVTPRLAFAETSLAEVPAFLRKDRPTPAAVAAIGDPDVGEGLTKDPGRYAEIPVEHQAPAQSDPVTHQPVDSGDDDPEALEAAQKPLDELSVEELRQHQEEVNKKIAEKQIAEKKAVMDQIAAVMKQYKITTEELVDALGGIKIRRRGVKAKPKYRDPKTGTIWSGRGKEPAWIKGQEREKFLIKN